MIQKSKEQERRLQFEQSLLPGYNPLSAMHQLGRVVYDFDLAADDETLVGPTARRDGRQRATKAGAKWQQNRRAELLTKAGEHRSSAQACTAKIEQLESQAAADHALKAAFDLATEQNDLKDVQASLSATRAALTAKLNHQPLRASVMLYDVGGKGVHFGGKHPKTESQRLEQKREQLHAVTLKAAQNPSFSLSRDIAVLNAWIALFQTRAARFPPLDESTWPNSLVVDDMNAYKTAFRAKLPPVPLGHWSYRDYTNWIEKVDKL